MTSFLHASCSSQGTGMLGAPQAPAACRRHATLLDVRREWVFVSPSPATSGDVHLAGSWRSAPLREGPHQCRDLHADVLARLGKHTWLAAPSAMGVPVLPSCTSCTKGQGWWHKSPPYAGLSLFGLTGMAFRNTRGRFCQRGPGGLQPSLCPGRSACAGGERQEPLQLA